MKLYYYIFLVFIIFSQQTYAKIESTNINYKLKLNILGIYLKIGEINSYVKIKDNDYSLIAII